MAKKSKITIEDLAKMMQGGFKAVDKKMSIGFKEVYEKMEVGFKKADEKMGIGFKDVDEKFKDVNEKMEVGFKDVYKKMEVGFQEVYKTIEDLAIMVQNGFEETRNETNKRFDKVSEWQHFADGKFDVIEHELLTIKHDLLEDVVHRNEFENVRERVNNLEIASAGKKK